MTQSLEKATFAELEAIIEHGLKTFMEVGTALQRILDAEMHTQAGYEDFDQYCRKRWGFSRQHAWRQMSAARTVKQITKTPANPAAGNVGVTEILPKTEKQARVLGRLDKPEEQAAAWGEAVAEAGGHQPTTRQVEEAVEQFQPEKKPVTADPETLFRRVVAACREAGVGKSRLYQLLESCYTPQDEAHQARKFKGPLSRDATGGRSVAARKDMEKHRQ